MTAAPVPVLSWRSKREFKALIAKTTEAAKARRETDYEENAVRPVAETMSRPVADMFRHMDRMDAFRESMRQTGKILAPTIAAKAAGTYTAPSLPIPPQNLLERGMTDQGEVMELPDFDDSVNLWEADQDTANHTDGEIEGLRLRDSEFVFYCKNRAGEVIEEEVYEKAKAARRKIDTQTMNMALALSSQGIPAFLPKSTPRVSIVDPLSEQRLDLPPVRRVNFFPATAKMRRAPMLKHLTAYAEKRKFLRMATFTIGQRRRLDRPGEVRAAYQFLHRRLSNFHASDLSKSHGAHMVFRSSEGGSLTRACPFPREKGTEEGVIYIHIHAHTFIYFDKQLSPRRFKRFISKVWNLWDHHWDFGRKIIDVNEACKYPFKGDEIEGLTDSEVAALYRETRRLHMVQPMGELREIIAARQQAAIKGRNWRSGKTQALELRFRPDWNARPRITPEERRAREYQRNRTEKLGLTIHMQAARLTLAANSMLCKAAKVRRALSTPALTAILRTVQTLQSAAIALLRFNPRPFVEKRLSGVRLIKAADKASRPAERINNRVCARLGPAPYFDRITRGALLVWNFDGNYSALRELPFVKDYAQAIAPQIARAELLISGAAPYHRVHTSHLTATRARAANQDPPGQLLAAAELWEHEPAENSTASNR